MGAFLRKPSRKKERLDGTKSPQAKLHRQKALLKKQNVVWTRRWGARDGRWGGGGGGGRGTGVGGGQGKEGGMK